MFEKILHILTYNGDGDNIYGDGMGTLVMGMGPGCMGMGTMSRGWGGDGVVSLSPCQSLITSHHPCTSVHRNATVFELVRTSDHI